MKASERDELLIRLDVRTENIEKITEKQEQHLTTLNNKVSKNLLNIDRNDKRLHQLENGVNLKFSKKQLATGGTGLITLLTFIIISIGKVLGWW